MPLFTESSATYGAEPAVFHRPHSLHMVILAVCSPLAFCVTLALLGFAPAQIFLNNYTLSTISNLLTSSVAIHAAIGCLWICLYFGRIGELYKSTTEQQANAPELKTRSQAVIGKGKKLGKSVLHLF